MHSLESREDSFGSLPSTATSSPIKTANKNHRHRHRPSCHQRRTSTFEALALDASGIIDCDESKRSSNDSSTIPNVKSSKHDDDDDDEDCELWEDFGVVEYLDRGLALADESTEEEREEAMRDTLATDTDILECEGGGGLSEFLFHIARTKYGKAYIRVIRTMLLNRVLCSDRVSQMTKTYNDIEAVTRLLEEKEKDLELTARIGKELLSHNQKLETTVQELENELKVTNEKITQLSYELGKKTELIQVLTNDVEECGNSEASTPVGYYRGINLDVMQRKIGDLEEENKQLRTEFSKLADEADDCEEHEARLVKDIANQLASANMEVDGIAEELDRQKDENRTQQEQIDSLQAKLQETELRLAQILAEHDEVGSTLDITRENQNALAEELAQFKERYAEVLSMLMETQEQLKTQRKREMPTARGGALFPSLVAAPQPDCIALELESSLYSESLDSGIVTDRMPGYKKVFDTVKSASRATAAIVATDAHQFPRLGSATMSTISSSSSGPRISSSFHLRNGSSSSRGPASIFPSLDSAGQSDSDTSLLTDLEEYPGPQQAGVPGAPGAADLEAALRRLTPAEVSARRACLTSGTGYPYDYDTGLQSPPASYMPLGCRTPDSIMSTGSTGNLSGFSGNSTGWRLPEKLQIVKPMEGSQTLHHWSQLATPTLGGLLEDRPGVRTRGGRCLEELGLETFTLADVEEDEEYLNPGKLFQGTGSVYTYTNSTVMHPDDLTIMSSSVASSRVASTANSAMNSGMNTPRALSSRRNSTSTFSTNFGIAKMLNERGIKAGATSSGATPTGDKSFSATTTPCNSPDITPSSSRSSSPTSAPTNSSSSMPLSLLTSGAELLKRTFVGETVHYGNAQSRNSRRSSRRDHPKRSTSEPHSGVMGSKLALQGALYSRRESPMAQLTFLKGSNKSSSSSSEKVGAGAESSAATSTAGDSGLVLKSPDSSESSSVLDHADNLAIQRRRMRQRRSAERKSLHAARSSPTEVISEAVEETESSGNTTLDAISSLIFGGKG